MASLWTVFAVSGGVLAFEIALMRILLYASWHHFAFLVISVALLGFGASGTLLSFAARRFTAGGDRWMLGLTVATALSMPIALQLMRFVPVEARFVPVLLGGSIGRWLLFWLIAFVPFFLGASAIGLALINAREHVARVYASNLIGSAFGAALVTAAMSFVAPAWLGVGAGALAFLGAFPMLTRGTRLATCLAAGAVTALWITISPPDVRTDPYKYISYVHRLMAGGRARSIATSYDARATVEVFEGGAFHDMPFLSGEQAPPDMLSIVADGHSAGSALEVEGIDEARIVDNLLMAAAYDLAPDAPRVLLLGEVGGVNVWLGARRGATALHVVQPHPRIPALLRGPLARRTGSVLQLPAVAVHVGEPRHFVERTEETFDLIHLVTMESWAVESGGIGGLGQEQLVTVEGLTACLERLSPTGVLAAARGIQLPPRDNIKLLGTMIEAMRRAGIEDAQDHVLIIRDYLAACTLVRRAPWTGDDVERVREVCRRRQLTPVHFPGIRDDELNQPDRLPGPEGAAGDWLHHAATRLLSDDASAFVRDWAFDVRPATDDRPFFGNFMKLRSIGLLRRAFGDLWLTRTEVSLLFVLVAIVVVGLAGVLLTVVPLLLSGAIRHSKSAGVTALYFAAIGLGYMMLEMTMLSRLVHLIGDPVRAGTAAICGFLFFSGLGCIVAQRATADRVVVTLAVAGIVVVALIESGLLPWAVGGAAAMSATWRVVMALLFVSPLGFFMGFPMPTALRMLSRREPALVPWAWGVNGFASVLAPPLATWIAMTVGFRMAGAGALACYIVAALVFTRLTSGRHAIMARDRAR